MNIHWYANILKYLEIKGLLQSIVKYYSFNHNNLQNNLTSLWMMNLQIILEILPAGTQKGQKSDGGRMPGPFEKKCFVCGRGVFGAFVRPDPQLSHTSPIGKF